ncbi:TetR/AcrR family transcriptional regulator [Alteribacillus sp. HJP-4]|uniref:TetR/AcrR family transcriptional regulator n=1 Tax=Alteribacillus sp. HJP-4 TaxID=2775394 RepID=UPI0035CCCE30
MPRGFSNKEKTHIRTTLKQTAFEHFCRLGLRKTSIGQITKDSGIAQGSFYSFFHSKEELFYELLLDEERRLKNKLHPFLTTSRPDQDNFARFLLTAVQEIEASPLISTLFQAEEYQALIRKVNDAELDDHTLKDLEELKPIFEGWQERGFMKDIEPELIISSIRSFILLSLHKKEIGPDWFDETVRLMAASLAAYVMKGDRRDD